MAIEWSFDESDDSHILEQPLFEEADEKHQRQDVYGGPYGVMIGGMALPSKFDLAVQYLDAADHLVASVRDQTVEDFTLANPILFLYRHSVEMLVKSLLVSPAKEHGLRQLLGQYRREVRTRYSADIPGWITDRIRELDAIDPASTAFRYASTYDKQLKRDVPVDGEIHVYFNNLQAVVRALHSALNDPPNFRTDICPHRGIHYWETL